MNPLVSIELGACAFGVVMGWITYRTLRHSEVKGLGDIATVLGTLGGAAVTTLFPIETGAFGAYCIGLAVGFFGYLGTAIYMAPKNGKKIEWLGSQQGTADRSPDALPQDRPHRRDY